MVEQYPAPIPTSTPEPIKPSKGTQIIKILMQMVLYSIFFFMGYIASRLQLLLENI